MEREKDPSINPKGLAGIAETKDTIRTSVLNLTKRKVTRNETHLKGQALQMLPYNPMTKKVLPSSPIMLGK
jgi:hypothetical protein